MLISDSRCTPRLPPTPDPGGDYCPTGYGDHVIRFNWGLSNITMVRYHQQCADRCIQYRHGRYNGGARAKCLPAGRYGNHNTSPCAPSAIPGHQVMHVFGLDRRRSPANTPMAVGGNCCSTTSSVVGNMGHGSRFRARPTTFDSTSCQGTSSPFCPNAGWTAGACQNESVPCVALPLETLD